MRRELEDLDELEEELEALEESREDSQPYNQPSYEPTTIRKSSSVVVMFRGTVVSDLVPPLRCTWVSAPFTNQSLHTPAFVFGCTCINTVQVSIQVRSTM